MIDLPRIAAIVVTYNSNEDLPECLDGLLVQEDVDLRTIVVDNASLASSREAMLSSMRQKMGDASILTSSNAVPAVVDHALRAIFVQNEVNGGYSAGNNIGARLAIGLGCQAVLIVNPDVRITDRKYVAQLAAKLMSHDRYAVAASAMYNLAGINENPMYELGFLEELFWPVWTVVSRLGYRPPSQRVQRGRRIEKVSGSCLLIRSSFLESIGYLDERVFLYCEEAILGAQVRNAAREIAYAPELRAVHAHMSSAKGNPTRRVKEWMRSRRHYHQCYARYDPLRRFLLRLSQSAVLGLVRVKYFLSERG